jgi:acetolactate synthase-1/3 small subunit
MKHTISVLVENKPGVLARVATLFSGRGYNIESLTVGPTHDASVSRMTIVVQGDDQVLEQVNKQLNKLVEVIKVADLTGGDFVDRELLLVRVAVTPQSRSEVIEIAQIFRAKIVNVQSKSLTIEITGNEGKLEAFLELMKTFGIRDLARTGKIAVGRR